MTITRQINVSDTTVPAYFRGTWRDVGRHEETIICLRGAQISLQLMNDPTRDARLPVAFNLNDNPPGESWKFQIDSVSGASVVLYLCLIDLSCLEKWNLLEAL